MGRWAKKPQRVAFPPMLATTISPPLPRKEQEDKAKGNGEYARDSSAAVRCSF